MNFRDLDIWCSAKKMFGTKVLRARFDIGYFKITTTTTSFNYND